MRAPTETVTISVELRKALEHGRRKPKLVGPSNPIEPATGDDPDDRVDPDDCVQVVADMNAPRSDRISEQPLALLPSNTPPPEQSRDWWIAIVLGRENDPVSPQDAQLALQWVAYRLESNHLSISIESSFSFHSSTTVGELHAQIRELFGEPGWDAAYDMWAQAAGIEQPERKQAAKHDPLRRRSEDGALPKLDTDGTPPPRVRAFFQHESKPSHPWRRQETVGDRELRAQAEEDGAWCG